MPWLELATFTPDRRCFDYGVGADANLRWRRSRNERGAGFVMDVGAGVGLMAGAGDKFRAATHTGIGMDDVEVMHFMPGQWNLATFDR